LGKAGRLAAGKRSGNLASRRAARHELAMRRFLISSSFVLLAACATRPQPIPSQQPLPQPSSPTSGGIFGLTSQELVQRFGTPALQIREGSSVKLQFRSRFCVLDAYLYPPVGQPAAPYRVNHVEARNRAMAPVDQATCLTTLQGA
jgi:hypothetical protein